LPPALVERAKAAAQRHLDAAEPEPASVEPCAGPAEPLPLPARRLTDRSFSDEDLDHLVAFRVREATAAGFVPQYPGAYRAAVRRRELAAEAERPGHIREAAKGLRSRSRGLS
jgi:hypothetical protein